MNPLIKSKNIRVYIVLVSYMALFTHLAILGGYHLSLANPSMPQFSFPAFVIGSIICIMIYILIPLSNRKYWIVLLKIVVALPLLILNQDYLFTLPIFVTLYYLLAFFDMYDYKIKV